MSQARIPTLPIDDQFLTRWSPRALTGAPIPQDTLLACFEAARWAPSASNIQPWRFLYAQAGSASFDAMLNSLVPFNQGWANKSSALVVVTSITASVPPGQDAPVALPWHTFDAGAAWMNFALQAHQLGLVTHAMGGFDAAALRASLGIPQDVAVHAVVAVGYQGDKASLPEALQARELPSPRKPLPEVVVEGGWSFSA